MGRPLGFSSVRGLSRVLSLFVANLWCLFCFCEYLMNVAICCMVVTVMFLLWGTWIFRCLVFEEIWGWLFFVSFGFMLWAVGLYFRLVLLLCCDVGLAVRLVFGLGLFGFVDWGLMFLGLTPSVGLGIGVTCFLFVCLTKFDLGASIFGFVWLVILLAGG